MKVKLNSNIEQAIEEVDAAVFTGDCFRGFEEAQYLMETTQRWQRELLRTRIENEIVDNIPDNLLNNDDSTNHFNDAIDYAMARTTDEGLEFLRCWREGDWEAIDEEWEDFEVPDSLRYPS